MTTLAPDRWRDEDPPKRTRADSFASRVVAAAALPTRPWLHVNASPRVARFLIEAGARRGKVMLGNVDLRAARVVDADLRGADLHGADLRGAHLSGADLTLASLTGVDLTGADLRGANLRGAYMTDANLTDADLTDANQRYPDSYDPRVASPTLILRGAILRGTVLRGAFLRWADLTGADLRRADLDGADLDGADLDGADLSGANLRGADLRGAHMTLMIQTSGATTTVLTDRAATETLTHLTGVLWSDTTQWPPHMAQVMKRRSEEVQPGVWRVAGSGSADVEVDTPLVPV